MHRIYLIESGRPLSLIKEWLAEEEAVINAREALLKSYGIDRYRAYASDGSVGAVVTDRPDFTKKGTPKRGTDAWREFKELPKYRAASYLISDTFGIPLTLTYAKGQGWRRIGTPFNECGFLYLNRNEGPFAMFVPDVEKYAAEAGPDVEPAKLPEIEGARLILNEEWELMVAQHRLAKVKK